jgi:transcription antitermination protein NusB
VSSGVEGPRSLARERALGLLYEAAVKSVSPSVVLAELPASPVPFARALVEGVEANLGQIDALIDSASVDWELSRMPVVDLSVLRIAVAELIGWPETPVAVILDEAVELVKNFSTDESGRFVNGVLATIASELRPGEPELRPCEPDVYPGESDLFPGESELRPETSLEPTVDG